MAWPCRLAATNPPPRDSDFFSMAQGYLSDAVLNQPVPCTVHGNDRDSGDLLVVIGTSVRSLGEEMVREGLLRVKSRVDPRLGEILQSLREKEAASRADRLNMWAYGDVGGGSDDEDSGRGRRR